MLLMLLYTEYTWINIYFVLFIFTSYFCLPFFLLFFHSSVFIQCVLLSSTSSASASLSLTLQSSSSSSYFFPLLIWTQTITPSFLHSCSFGCVLWVQCAYNIIIMILIATFKHKQKYLYIQNLWTADINRIISMII